jgi:hypothetical protein
MRAANDNNPQKLKVGGILRHRGIPFHASELALFIKYDLKFGNPIYEYPTSEDGLLRSGGSAIRFYDENGRQLWVAVIAEAGNEDYADKWRLEIYRYKHEACGALEKAHKKYVVIDPADEDGADDDNYGFAA